MVQRGSTENKEKILQRKRDMVNTNHFETIFRKKAFHAPVLIGPNNIKA